MKPAVHILATVRNPALLDAALLVFKTLRTGFPDNPVHVWGNALTGDALHAVAWAARHAGAKFQNLNHTSHDQWIQVWLDKFIEPFWICDTDIVFHAPLNLNLNPVFAGRLTPEFDEEFTGMIHVARLHSCLMYIHPGKVRAAMREVFNRLPSPWTESAKFALVWQTVIPRRGQKALFYDVMAGLYQAGFGTAFTPEQDAAFDHLHCATYADLIAPHLNLPGGGNLLDSHRAVYANPALLNGRAKESQSEYYHARKPKEAHAI